MVVEDDPLDFGFLQTAFESISVPVELFNWPTVEGAIEAILDKSCDIAIVDISLHGGSGIELVREIRANEKLALMPVIALSSSINPCDVVGCYREGANAYLEKPLSMEKYRNFVQAFSRFWLQAAVLPGQ